MLCGHEQSAVDRDSTRDFACAYKAANRLKGCVCHAWAPRIVALLATLGQRNDALR